MHRRPAVTLRFGADDGRARVDAVMTSGSWRSTREPSNRGWRIQIPA